MPKAVLTPSFSITRTAASAAVILLMAILLRLFRIPELICGKRNATNDLARMN
jgi:hypothetical protein